MVDIHRSAGVGEFLAMAGDYLTTREAEHNLMLGICSGLARNPDPSSDAPYLGVALDDGSVVAAALRTPPMNLILSESDDPATIEAFALDVHELYGALPGVLGPREGAAAFARSWGEIVGVDAKRVMQERIYRAREARPPAGIPGAMRPYRTDDRELVLAWIDAFVTEAFPEDVVTEPVERVLERRLDDTDGGYLLWEVDGSPVSLAGFGSATPNGIRIGPVFTPPPQRRRGFAAALVGTMTQTLLARGHRFCFLFTDLANPTSNSVYQRVGYEPVGDVDQYAFVQPTSADGEH